MKKKIANILPMLPIGIYQIFDINLYSHKDIEKNFVSLFLLIITQAIGSIFIGTLSDKFGRKPIYTLTQLFGFISNFILYFTGINMFILYLTAVFYNPLSVCRAALVDNSSNANTKTIIAWTVIAQAIPWSFYLIIENQSEHSVFLFISLTSLFSTVISYFTFTEKKIMKQTKTTITHEKINPQVIFTLAAFLLAETVYFLTAITIETADEINNGLLFIVIGISVSLGALIHLLIKKWHINSLQHIISSTYFLGAILMLLVFISNYILKLNCFFPFIGIICCLGGVYIPFVFIATIEYLQSKHRGLSCGIVESMQSLAAIIAPLLFLFSNEKEKLTQILLILLYLGATIISMINQKIRRI